MSTEIRDELAAFERDLAALMARFIRLYERVENQVRPERTAAPVPPPAPPAPRAADSAPALLPGYH
jgi:hypothetical protein